MRDRWGTTSLVLAALLALSCQRNLGRPSADGGGGGARSSGGGNGTADFDPGPGIDPIFGDISFVSRFTF